MQKDHHNIPSACTMAYKDTEQISSLFGFNECGNNTNEHAFELLSMMSNMDWASASASATVGMNASTGTLTPANTDASTGALAPANTNASTVANASTIVQ